MPAYNRLLKGKFSTKTFINDERTILSGKVSESAHRVKSYVMPVQCQV